MLSVFSRVVLFVALTAQTAFSDDPLKRSLSSLLHKKDAAPAMVNLDMPVAKKPISRSAQTVVAVALGEKLRKKDLDAFLAQRTQGKVNDFDRLSPEQRIALVREYMLPKYIVKKAMEHFPFEERKAMYASAWLQESVRNTEIPEEKVQEAYNAMIARMQAQPTLQSPPPYDAIKDRIRHDLAQRQIIGQLMQGVSVRLDENKQKGVVGYVGDSPVSLKEAEKAAQAVTRGAKTWEMLNEQEKIRLLHMIAPQKVIAKIAMKNLTLRQKHNLISNVWMQNELAHIEVSDEALKKRYAALKKERKRHKKPLPSFEEAKPALKAQLAQEKLMKRLIKEIHVTLK